eukprot:131884_1
MADLSVIPYVFHWMILIILCRKPFYLLLMFTCGVYFNSVAYVLTGDNAEAIISDWGWFDYVKRLSLVIGYLSYVWIFTTNSKASRIFSQWVLALNVAEAGVLALEYLEIVSGVLLIACSPFSPRFFRNKENKTLLGEPGNLLQRERFNYLSVKWYFRCHLIILGAWYITSVHFNIWHTTVFLLLTCVIPLAANEYCFDNFVNHFNIRTFALFIATANDSSFDPRWVNKQPPDMVPDDLNIIVRNCIQLSIILFLFGLCVLNDKLRGNKGERQEIQEEEMTTHMETNEPNDKV